MFRIFLIFVLFFYNAHIATASDAVLLDKIEHLENRILSLETQKSGQTTSPGNDAPTHTRLLELEEKMRELNGKLETIEHEYKILTQKTQNLATDVDMRFSQQKQPLAPNPAPTEHKESVNTDQTNLTQDTPAAAEFKPQNNSNELEDQLTKYNEMISNGEYNKAIAGLEKFVVTHKMKQQAGEAYYLIGIANTKLKQNDKAAINFLKSYKTYPENIKAADSLLRLSSVLVQLNKKTKACEILQKLDNEYPDRSSANKQKTAEAKAKLKCS